MTETKTDEHVICEFMEPKPEPAEICAKSRGGWWWFNWDSVTPVPINNLHLLHEVETRLTAEQWEAYEFGLNAHCEDRGCGKSHWWAIHATAEQKIKALAAVLRAEVAGGK